MGKMLVFDMDGTLADLYNVPNWLEKLRACDPSPYIEAKPLWDMEKLRITLLMFIKLGWEVRVVSWLSKDSTPEYDTAVRKAKKEWLERYNFPVDKVHLVQFGTTKANCVRKWASPGILIDDSEKVRNGWTLGDCIDPTAISDLPEALDKYLENEIFDLMITCPFCGRAKAVEVPVVGYRRWKCGELIQDALSELNKTDREMLLSGLCPDCQNKIFN